MGFYRHNHNTHKTAPAAQGPDRVPVGKVTPLVSRVELNVSDDVDQALGRVRDAHGEAARARAAAQFAAEVAEGSASYGGMLASVWQEAKRTLDEVREAEDMPVAKRIAALRDLGRLLPMLAKAEATHKARIGDKTIEDMTDRQLEAEYKRIRRTKRTKVG